MARDKNNSFISVRRATMVLAGLFFIGMAAASAAQAQTFQVLYTFSNGQDGANPNGLTIDRAGNFYGTTHTPGSCFTGGCGAVFKFSRSGPGWILSPLYRFQGGTDGSWPNANVTLAPDGSLYGTTTAGGGGTCNLSDIPGCGTVFHLQPPAQRCASVLCAWHEDVLHRFADSGDLANPYGRIAFDSSGVFYGTANQGGPARRGGVFVMNPSQGGWSYSIVYSFSGAHDPAGPYGGVIVDPAANIYGTTYGGGVNGGGTAYELSPSGSGWSETILHSFNGQMDGDNPLAGLMRDTSGNLFGTTLAGGQNGDGTVFELSPLNGGFSFSVLYGMFNSSYGSGQGPQAKLVMDLAGNLYGTQYGGGANNQGMVFKLTPGEGGWNFTDLHDFNYDDGSNPDGDLVVDSDGNVYGTTSGGGPYNGGVIWEITP